MHAITSLGSTATIVPATAIVVLALLVRRHALTAIYVAVAVAGGSLLSALSKHAIGRDRPPVPLRLAEVSSSAFPSGHATQAAATYLAFAVVFTRVVDAPARVRAVIWATAALVVTLVGISRIYLGVHWATDVIAGWLLGATWVAGLSTRRFTPRPQPARQ
jgi:undecaprenyl-diphosphatase